MKKKIIIVEDDPDLQHISSSVLLKAGFDVVILDDERRILEDPLILPDLYILDIELPHISGLELCQQLRANAATRLIPILIVSANAQLLSLAKQACANDSLAKPFEASSLVKKVTELILEKA